MVKNGGGQLGPQFARGEAASHDEWDVLVGHANEETCAACDGVSVASGVRAKRGVVGASKSLGGTHMGGGGNDAIGGKVKGIG